MPKKMIDLELLEYFRQKYDLRLENGNLVPNKSVFAENLTPVSEESGDTQETPFILQGTGTANGTAVVDTGKTGKHIEKQGTTVCVNQIMPPLQSGQGYAEYNYSTSYSFSDGVVTISASGTGDIQNPNSKPIVGHKYLIMFDYNPQTQYLYVSTVTGVQQLDYFTSGLTLNAWQHYQKVFTAAYASQIGIRIQNGGKIKNWIMVDLTQWFVATANIPSDLISHPEHWSWYQNYGDYIAYNIGELVNADGRYLTTTGRNQWDEQVELGKFSDTTGNKTSGTSNLRSVNPTNCKPKTTYYIKCSKATYFYFYDANGNFIEKQDISANSTMITPANATSFNFYIGSGYGTTYNHDITISIYYATGDGYDQYYPYEEPNVYDTGTEPLRSIGVKLNVSGEREDIHDSKAPDGTIARRVGTYTFTGNETWDTFGSCYRTQITNLNAKNVGASNVANVISNTGLPVVSVNDTYSGYTGISVNDNYIQVSSTTGLTGKIIYFELATPTTEQGTPFAENILIDDYGTMGWDSDLPQGCKIFYPAWYVGFIDSLGQRADIDWDAENIVSQTQLSASETARDTVDAQLLNAIGGTLRQLLASSQSVDFNNTDYIDLGTLNWSNYSTPENHIFRVSISSIPNMKSATDNNTPAKVVCTLYKNMAYSPISASDNMCMAVSSSSNNYVVFINTAYSDTDTFKAAMKGVLLAYEKA